MLTGVGHVRISGGCEVHAEGRITVVPVDEKKATVRLDNSGRWFFDGKSDALSPFEVDLPAEEISGFVENLKRLAGSSREETELFTTRNATVSLEFPLSEGDFRFSGSDDQGWCRLDPIIDSIEAFVASCHKKAEAGASSAGSVSPGSRTEKFLGSPEERAKAVFLFQDMNGLHGGRVVALTGQGNVMVQTVSPEAGKGKMRERRYSFDISPEQTGEIVTEMINADVLSIELEDRPGVPDEVRNRFSITNSKNETFALEAWANSSLPPMTSPDHPRMKFDRACLALRKLARLAEKEKTPLHEGPYGGG